MLLALASLAPTACASAAPAAHASPALWQVKDNDTTIYLFGSMHALPPELKWQSAKVSSAIAKSDALVLEVILGDDKSVAARTMLTLGSPAQPLPPLLDRVPADKRAQLQGAIAASNIPNAFLDKLESWAAALILSATLMQNLPMSRDAGVEAILTQQFKDAKKPATGLETVTEQLGYFDTLPEPAQRALLATVTADAVTLRKQYDAMVTAWCTGQMDAITAAFDEELKASPELAAALLTRRNAAWTRWLRGRMDQPGTVFVAVGAGHLAGPNSVVAMLEKQGIKVTRVQ